MLFDDAQTAETTPEIPLLTDYLTTLITPPKGTVLHLDPSSDTSQYADTSIHGIVFKGHPTEAMIEEMDRILVPGAHVVLITEDAGYESTTVMENKGFEVRDAIFLAEDGDTFKYASKASSTERSLGLETQNLHPTVKPIEIMEWCLRDIPEGSILVEPFGGSGTTAIAARDKYHLTTIEMTPEYASIIDARLRYWASPDHTRIESEAHVEAECTVEDFFSGATAPASFNTGHFLHRIWIGRCEERMRDIPDNSVDAIVTDPPYGLKFMNYGFDDLGEGESQRKWHEEWLREAYRILKPGGVIKAFSGTRTQHHLEKAMYDVGFRGKDGPIEVEAWVYSSGFPKSRNLYELDLLPTLKSNFPNWKAWDTVANPVKVHSIDFFSTALEVKEGEGGIFEIPESVAAWKGYGTTLKPAWEPVAIGRKNG